MDSRGASREEKGRGFSRGDHKKYWWKPGAAILLTTVVIGMLTGAGREVGSRLVGWLIETFT